MIGLISCFGLLLLLAFGTLRRPAVAFAGVLCLYGIKQWGQSSTVFFSQNRTLVNLVIAALVVIGLLRRWSNVTKDDAAAPRVWLLSIALYIYAFLTLVWTPDSETAWGQWIAWGPYVLTISTLAPLLIVDSDDVKRVCLWTVIVGGVVCALALLFGNWGYRGLIVQGYWQADVRNETNPLAIATLGGTVAIISMASVFSPGSVYKRLLFAVMIPVGIAVILRSGSRGQLIFCAAAMLVGMPLASRKRNIGTVLTIGISMAIVAQLGWWIWEQLGVSTARWTGERSAEDVAGRLAMATTLLSAAWSNPLAFIAGLGNSSSFSVLGIYPHVAPLEILAEEGIVGIGIYVAILFFTFTSIKKLWKHSRDQHDTNLQYAVALLTTLFLFEWLLTFKQGTLLSSIYAFAYASILERLAKRTEQPSTIKNDVFPAEYPSTHPNLLSNLMR